jgi:hypothetical protein
MASSELRASIVSVSTALALEWKKSRASDTGYCMSLLLWKLSNCKIYKIYTYITHLYEDVCINIYKYLYMNTHMDISPTLKILQLWNYTFINIYTYIRIHVYKYVFIRQYLCAYKSYDENLLSNKHNHTHVYYHEQFNIHIYQYNIYEYIHI